MGQPIKIYVGNIPASARNSELKELFEKFGKVVECDILKEFAFVHMDDTDAKAAIAGLNDSLWKGARIRVELSTTKTNKGEPSLRHRLDDRQPRRRYSHDREPRPRSPPRYRDSRGYPDSRYGGPAPYRDSGRLPARDSRYGPPPRSSRPYPEITYDRRGFPIESRGGAPRGGGYPPEYPFHPASYRDAPRGGASYDPYSRAPMGYGQPVYYRGPPMPRDGRYEYPPQGAYPPRPSRYSPPPRDLYREKDYRALSPLHRRHTSRDQLSHRHHSPPPISKSKRHHSSESRSVSPAPIRHRNGHHRSRSTSRTPSARADRYSSSKSPSPLPKKRNGHSKKHSKKSSNSNSADSSFTDLKSSKTNGHKDHLSPVRVKKALRTKRAASSSPSRSRSMSNPLVRA